MPSRRIPTCLARSAICFVAVALTMPSLFAQQAAEATEPPVFAIAPMSEPDPLLRYRLWPAPQDRRDLNPAPFVSRAVILSLQMPAESRKEFGERFNQWSEMPLEQLPRDQVRRLVNSHSAVLGELARAERLMAIKYNLQLEDLSAPELVATLLPEFQEMRQLARLLHLRARLAIAERRWEDVVDDCRLGFRLSEFAGHSTDFLVGRLVGFAIAGIMMNVIEEAIQHPQCPNLYWALASLPDDRLFETRESIEYESVLLGKIVEGAGKLPDHPIGEQAARDKIRTILRSAQSMLEGTGGENSKMAQLLGGIYVASLADPSREMLAATSEWGDRAAKLSAPEAVLRATQLKVQRARDRWLVWTMLPPELSNEYAKEREAAIGNQDSPDILERLVTMLTPAVDAAQRAGLRMRQQRNLLITLEALRMRAARQGELPATIDKLRPVPAWHDAMAHQPFGYARQSAHQATLTRESRWPGDEETTIKIELMETR